MTKPLAWREPPLYSLGTHPRRSLDYPLLTLALLPPTALRVSMRGLPACHPSSLRRSSLLPYATLRRVRQTFHKATAALPRVPQQTLWLAPDHPCRRRREGEGNPRRSAHAGRLIVLVALSKLERLVELMDFWTLIIHVTQIPDVMD